MKSTISNIFLLFISIAVFAQEAEQEFELVKLDRKVNSRYHDTAPVISPDGQTLYFFITNHPDNTFGKDNTQDIWFCEKDGSGQWKQAQHMGAPFNRNKFNQVMSISTDGNRLLLRGGGSKNKKGFSIIEKVNGQWGRITPLEVKDYGKMNKGRFSGGFLSYSGDVLLMYFNETEKAKYSDLYVSFKLGGNKFSKPKPLPTKIINTRLDEFGPYLATDDKTLYFASNRAGGFGSTDIYKTTRLDDSWLSWSKPVNLGEPINTSGFDAYYSVDETGNHGFTTRTYMSADGGSMDILGVVPKVKPVVKTFISGFIFDAKTEEPIEATIKYHLAGASNEIITHPDEGLYEFEVLEGGKFNFEISAKGFMATTDSIEVYKQEIDSTFDINFYLKPLEVGLTVRLDKIYFDFDKTTLRDDSFSELNKVVKMLEENPELKIEIAGHTDDKGSDMYNKNLSQGRAEAVRSYLLSKWVAGKRVIATGYGEEVPEVTNDTEEGRQTNRRVEFKVLSN